MGFLNYKNNPHLKDQVLLKNYQLKKLPKKRHFNETNIIIIQFFNTFLNL